MEFVPNELLWQNVLEAELRNVRSQAELGNEQIEN